MKRLMLICLIVFCFSGLGLALAESGTNRLDIAFGLFAVDLPEGVTAGPNTGNILSDYRFETDGAPQLIYANFAPTDEYASTARRKLDSLVSMVFALSGGDPGSYSETEIQEETLENGVRLRWQLMRGDALHALWFEAFDDRFGYNMCLQSGAKAADDDVLLAMMRSFRADPGREQDLLDLRQTKLPGGMFISVEHGLQIHLTDEWNAVTYRDFLYPGTAFALEKGEGRWMIQLLCTNPVDPEDGPALLAWLLQNQGMTDAASDPVRVPLESLGTEAWVAEVDADVIMLNVAFVYEGYGYYGLFMWIAPDDAEARPFMTEALRTLTAPAE